MEDLASRLTREGYTVHSLPQGIIGLRRSRPFFTICTSLVNSSHPMDERVEAAGEFTSDGTLQVRETFDLAERFPQFGGPAIVVGIYGEVNRPPTVQFEAINVVARASMPNTASR